MSKILVFQLFFLISAIAQAKDPYKRNPAIDIQQYIFQLEVNDSTNVIAGKASVIILFKKSISSFTLNLAGLNAKGEGMTVSTISLDHKLISFEHLENNLKIILPNATEVNQELTFEITYSGIPEDGLIIGLNKYGDRGFFGDNWPDRGHYWLPVVDHPSDKSAVQFIIIAPHHYSVIANGIKMEESFIDEKRKLTHWKEEVPIPVKVMVVGIARFAIQLAGKVDGISIESWVYPQNKADGFSDYSVAVKVLDYFNRNIGQYPFKKLANVQSKTRWGGLENASAIFYSESSVNGKGDHESLIAHEEAHQWFGNSATENDWHHVWLSEGFATYFANLYLENVYGHEKLIQEEIIDREEVIKYYQKNQAPIIDTTLTDINKVLSTNTYQKAGWVLHMLRHKLGDEIFWKGIRTYYNTYRNGNAMTNDFIKIMEEASDQSLIPFFNQWLRKPGHPKLEGTWHYSPNKKELTISLNQIQKETFFTFPLEISVTLKNGSTKLETFQIGSKTTKMAIKVDAEPTSIALDPHTWLLFEGTLQKK